jgi:transcriptional regulator with XRE-family HTH domain
MTDKEQARVFGMNLSYYVAKRKRETGMSQKDIAAAIGIAPQTFNNWCNGKVFPPLSRVQIVADYFGIGKTDLIEDRGEPKEYYLDDESREMAEFLKNNRDYRVLFDAMRTVRPTDIQSVIDFIDKANGGGNN